jgi:hypothetical protein
MPQTFRFVSLPFSTDKPEIILPERFDSNQMILGLFNYQGVARLKPGITLEQASADVEHLLAVWLDSWPSPPGLDRQFFDRVR